MKSLPIRLCATALASALALAAAPPAAAQDDGARPAAREREALHRAQAALRESQEQESALARDKTELSAQRDQLSEVAKKSQSQLLAARADNQRQQAELAATQEALKAAREQDEADRKEAMARIDELSQHLGKATQTADERSRANAALVVLLERSTQALTAAERANAQMHALGLQMIEAIRSGSVGARLQDPVFGFGQIRLENKAEDLRDQLDKARLINNVKP